MEIATLFAIVDERGRLLKSAHASRLYIYVNYADAQRKLDMMRRTPLNLCGPRIATLNQPRFKETKLSWTESDLFI